METTKDVKPEWVRNLQTDSEIFLDVGRYLRNGMDPMEDIRELLADLRPCQHLHLARSREPVLFYRAFRPMGFDCYVEQEGPTWDVYLKRRA